MLVFCIYFKDATNQSTLVRTLHVGFNRDSWLAHMETTAERDNLR
jgi:hypothetical protein